MSELTHRGFTFELMTAPEPGVLIRDPDGDIVDTLADDSVFAAVLAARSVVDKILDGENDA